MTGQMTDDELVEQFESGALDPGSFRHHEHLRVAWYYLVTHGRATAERRLLEMLRAFAVRAGRPEKFDAALTRAWIAALDHAREAHPAARTFDQLAAVRPDLLVAARPELLDQRPGKLMPRKERRVQRESHRRVPELP